MMEFDLGTLGGVIAATLAVVQLLKLKSALSGWKLTVSGALLALGFSALGQGFYADVFAWKPLVQYAVAAWFTSMGIAHGTKEITKAVIRG